MAFFSRGVMMVVVVVDVGNRKKVRVLDVVVEEVQKSG